MNKKKIRKSLSRAHKAIKPMTNRLSHRDIKHVNDGMRDIKLALSKADSQAPKTFFKNNHLSNNGKKWIKNDNGVANEVTTNDMLNIINDASRFIKHNY